ncbi:hypothetical protein ACFXPJ_38835, partial [Streptomyces goshikiensis]
MPRCSPAPARWARAQGRSGDGPGSWRHRDDGARPGAARRGQPTGAVIARAAAISWRTGARTE